MTLRSVWIVALVGWVLAACGGDPAGVRDAEPSVCEQLRADYGAIIATFDQSCTSDGQCTTIDATKTCDCYEVISGHCEGFPYSAASATLEQRNTLADLSYEYRAHQCGVGVGTCDCAPQPAHCRNGTCVNDGELACNPDPPDASPL